MVSEINSTWHAAIEVPGSGALGANPNVTAVSCASAGNCAAGGAYTGTFNQVQAFVDIQANGTWGTATEVPRSAALNADGAASATSASCPSPGSCAVGGSYRDGSGHFHAFVDGQA